MNIKSKVNQNLNSLTSILKLELDLDDDISLRKVQIMDHNDSSVCCLCTKPQYYQHI
jgi:hypothetical protein